MPQIPLHVALSTSSNSPENPLPTLLHTPTGLALLELQGTVHFPAPTASGPSTTQIGKLVFPLYNPATMDPSDTKWMKRVYMYVGKGQRMTGECKKLGKPIGIMRKRGVKERGGNENADADMEDDGQGGNKNGEAKEEELEIVEIVKYKIVFSARPEPITGVREE